MTHNLKDLTVDDIRRLLTKLDAELARQGHKAVVYIVGGANIALTLDRSRTTTDIDAVIKQGFEYVLKAARAVASTEEGLGADWLNAAFTGDKPDGGLTWPWMDNRDADTPSTAYKGDALTVELASPQMMLALKTLAQREKDLDDIYLLMRTTGITTPLELGRNLAKFTGRRIFDAQQEPAMYLHIDPEFRYIFDNAPDDLRPVEKATTSRQRHGKAARCPVEETQYRGDVLLYRKRCVRTDGHRGRHRFRRI